MKKQISIVLAIGMVSLLGCDNTAERTNENEALMTDEPVLLEKETFNLENTCFRYASPKDTILVHIERVDPEINGKIIYDYLEQPERKGTFKGRAVGDTIFADYTYDKDGIKTVKEVVFIKKDSVLVEGYGETEEVNGKTKFKPNAIFTFNEVMSLEKVDCGEVQ